jgi:hypothetical protein
VQATGTKRTAAQWRALSCNGIVHCRKPKKETRRNFGVTKVAPGGFARWLWRSGWERLLPIQISDRKQTRRGT